MYVASFKTVANGWLLGLFRCLVTKQHLNGIYKSNDISLFIVCIVYERVQILPKSLTFVLSKLSDHIPYIDRSLVNSHR